MKENEKLKSECERMGDTFGVQLALDGDKIVDENQPIFDRIEEENERIAGLTKLMRKPEQISETHEIVEVVKALPRDHILRYFEQLGDKEIQEMLRMASEYYKTENTNIKEDISA